MALPRTRALRALPLAVAVPLAALPAGAAATPAQPHTIVRSTFGVGTPVTAASEGRTVLTFLAERAGSTLRSAEHAPGSPAWPAPVTVAPAAPVGVSLFGLRTAADAGGSVVAVWLVGAPGPTGTTVTVRSARRTGAGTWSVLPDLAVIPDAGEMTRQDLPRTVLDVAVTPDGSAVAVFGTADGAVRAARLPAGAAAWDPPVSVRGPAAGRLTQETADLAVAAGPDGRVIAVWTETSATNGHSIQTAEWSGAAWSAPVALPGADNGFYPDVAVTPSGETIAAWYVIGSGNWVATRPAGGAWSTPVRAGGGYSPEIHVGTNRVAITWGTAGRGVAVRDTPSAAWTPSTAPVPPLAAVFGRDDQLLIAGQLASGVVVWSRLPPGGSWAAARVASRQRDLLGTSGIGLTPAASGPLATLTWAALVREGRLGMPRGGGVMQGLDISSSTGEVVGSSTTVRLPPTPLSANAYSVMSVSPRFGHYSGPVPVRIQTRRGGRWHTVAITTADVDGSVSLRLGGPGRVKVRLAYGPGFRRATNAVTVLVRATALRRVIAGWQPVALAASGNDLWVLSNDRAFRRSELRLLDARTGRLRRGPVALGAGPFTAFLLDTGNRVLLNEPVSSRTRVLDAALPGLLGADATFGGAAGCTPAGCTPVTVTAGGTSTVASRSVIGAMAPLQGPDGRVWGLGPGVDDEGGGSGVTVLESVAGGPPVTRDARGFAYYHGGFSADLLAVDGGLWFRGALGALMWVGPTGPGIAKGNMQAIAGHSGCAWGLQGSVGAVNGVVRLREGSARSDSPISVPLAGITVEDKPAFAVAPRTAWVIANGEQTLVKVPLPAC